MNKPFRIEGYDQRLSQAIEESGLSALEIAKRMGVSRKTVQPGTRACGMHSSNLARFCSVTGVSADWLLGLRRDKTW